MNNNKILEELLNDIESMSIEELKASLVDHVNGPIYTVIEACKTTCDETIGEEK